MLYRLKQPHDYGIPEDGGFTHNRASERELSGFERQPSPDVRLVTSILIIEEKPQSLQELEALLQRESFEVVRLSSPGGAVAQVKRITPSLVVLELISGGQGLDICRALQDSPIRSEIPVIGVMRRTRSNLLLQAYSAGMIDVLTDTASTLECLARILLHLDLAKSGQTGFYRARLRLLAERTLAESSSSKGHDPDASREFEALLVRLKSCASRLPRVQQLAEELGCSPRCLDALFRRETGKPAATYLNDLRHELACDWLSNTGLKISQIAGRLGYQHPGDFTRAFRTRAGCTPRAYRQSRLLPAAPLRQAREKTLGFRHSYSGEAP